MRDETEGAGVSARLEILQGGRSSTVVLEGEGFRIGSAPGNGLVLADAEVSREHVELRHGPRGWKVVDLESAGGTQVNGRFVNQHHLEDGDTITLGGTRIIYHGPGSVASSRPVTPAPAPGIAAVPMAAAAPARAGGAPARPAAPARMARSRRDAPVAFEAWILIVIIGVIGIGAAVVMLGGGWGTIHPNGPLLDRAKELNKAERYEEVLALESLATRDEDKFLPRLEAEFLWARTAIDSAKMATLEKEATRFLEWNIRKWQQENRQDTRGLIERYDEFLEKFHGTTFWQDVADRRLKLAGAPSPAALSPGKATTTTGNTDSGVGTSAPALLRAATEEADRLADKDHFADAIAVYERFKENATGLLSGSARDPFLAEIEKRMQRLESKARAAFEKLDVRAFSLEESGDIEGAINLYRRASETYGLDEIVDRCKNQIDRLRKLR